MTARLLLLNGSVRGSEGNSARLLARAERSLPQGWQGDTVTLAEYTGTVEALADRLTGADALLIASGVYWGSWGSPLQRFLEVIGAYELSPCFLGKPVGAAMSADSVGGLDVAQRLLGVFSLLGCIVPPLSTLVVSRVGKSASESNRTANEDVWQVADLDVVVKNVTLARGVLPSSWATWPVRELARVSGPYPACGVLEAGLEKFV
jgi:NAD(P)H-dependent FMN reductase